MTSSSPVAKAEGAKTNKQKDSLVKIVVMGDQGKWVRPTAGEKFFIDEDAKFPTIEFEIETSVTGPYKWSWTLKWVAAASGLRESSKRGRVVKTFTSEGAFTSDDKAWIADIGMVAGGVLTVKISTPEEKFKRSVYILGKNPDERQINKLLSTLPDVKGYENLLAQESRFKQFIDADGYPVVAFDGGYGMAQLTTPAPTYEQTWNWKKNIEAGALLYQLKQAEAKKYLGKANRTYTDEQLKLETWARWNGGAYHVWDPKENIWIRNPILLADSKTGNIGWDMTKPENAGKTEGELRERDKDEYSDPPEKSKRLWMYSGVFYADHLNK